MASRKVSNDVKIVKAQQSFSVIIGLSMTDVAFGAAFVLTGLYRFPVVFSYQQHGKSVSNESKTRAWLLLFQVYP